MTRKPREETDSKPRRTGEVQRDAASGAGEFGTQADALSAVSAAPWDCPVASDMNFVEFDKGVPG